DVDPARHHRGVRDHALALAHHEVTAAERVVPVGVHEPGEGGVHRLAHRGQARIVRRVPALDLHVANHTWPSAIARFAWAASTRTPWIIAAKRSSWVSPFA